MRKQQASEAPARGTLLMRDSPGFACRVPVFVSIDLSPRPMGRVTTKLQGASDRFRPTFSRLMISNLEEKLTTFLELLISVEGK